MFLLLKENYFMLNEHEPFLATSTAEPSKIKTKSLHGAIGGALGGVVGGLTTVFFTSDYDEYFINSIGGITLGASLGALLGVFWAYQERMNQYKVFEKIELFMLNVSTQIIITSLLNLAKFSTEVNFKESLICGSLGALTAGLFSELNSRSNYIRSHVVSSEKHCCITECFQP